MIQRECNLIVLDILDQVSFMPTCMIKQTIEFKQVKFLLPFAFEQIAQWT